MGMSLRAYLAYGVDLGSVEDWKAEPKAEYGGAPDEWCEDPGTLLEEAILKASGFTAPEPERYPPGYVRPEYGTPGYWDRVEPDPEWTAWSQAKAEALKALGVEYDASGYSGGGMESVGHLLVVAGTRKSVEWTESLQVDVATLASTMELDGISRDWNLKLASVLKAAGLTKTGQPGWLMYAYYG